MFKTLATITLWYSITFMSLIMFSSNAKSQTTEDAFIMNVQMVCDDTKKIAAFVNENQYKLIAGGLTTTSNRGNVLITVYGNKENVVVLGVDPSGFTCFIVEINHALHYEYGIKKHMLAPKKDTGPKIAS